MKKPSLLLLSLLLSRVALAGAIEVADVKQNLLENYRYLVESQATCAGSFDNGNYVCDSDTPGKRRILGSWDSYIVPTQVKIPTLRFLDSNVFVTSNTILPLYGIRFEDENLEKQRSTMIDQAMKSINVFQRGDGFAFWPQLNPLIPGQVSAISPLNMSALVVSSQLDLIKKLDKALHVELFPSSGQFMEKNFDSTNKDVGIMSEVDVPNDADDTAVAITSNFYWNRDAGQDLSPYLKMAKEFAAHTDNFEERKGRNYQDGNPSCVSEMNAASSTETKDNLFREKDFLKSCSLDDSRESYRYDAFPDTYSKAFLSWLYDEKAPVYSHPQEGVALPGQNSVDCDINANVLYSLSLTGMKNDPSLRASYEDACNYMSALILDEQNHLRMGISGRKIDKKAIPTWQYCGLFYPVHMTFPYVLSRAISEGNACQDLKPSDQERFDLAIKTLTEDVLREQDESNAQKKAGEWFENVDSSTAFPTAMGGVALLNFQKAYGDKLAIDRQDWKNHIEQAMSVVMATNERMPSQDKQGMVSAAPEGAFFGGGFTDEAGLWMSRPLATSVSMELMAKYLLTYDTTNTGSILKISASDLKSVTPDAHTTETSIANSSPKILPMVNLLNESATDASVDGSVGLGENVKEAVIGVELTNGSIYNGDFQSADEKVAYYRVKLHADAGADLDDGNVNRFNVDARFLGISTKANDLFSDEVGFLPVHFIHEDDINTASLYLGYADIHSPVKQIGDQTFLNIDMTAKLVGLVQKADETSMNLADVKIGMSIKHGDFSLSAAVDTAIGATRYGDGSLGSSFGQYGIEGKLQYDITKNQSIAAVAQYHSSSDLDSCDSSDLCGPGDEVGLQYSYRFGLH